MYDGLSAVEPIIPAPMVGFALLDPPYSSSNVSSSERSAEALLKWMP